MIARKKPKDVLCPICRELAIDPPKLSGHKYALWFEEHQDAYTLLCSWMMLAQRRETTLPVSQMVERLQLDYDCPFTDPSNFRRFMIRSFGRDAYNKAVDGSQQAQMKARTPQIRAED